MSTLAAHIDGDWIMARVNVTPAGCWEWTSTLAPTGYGMAFCGSAHRLSYRVLIGPIPDGLEIDHLCRNRPCVNPEHLEAVTRQENVKRAFPPIEDAGGWRTRWARAIRIRRHELGMTQVELATAVGVTQCALVRWELAKAIPRDDTKIALARVLGVNPDVLFAFTRDDLQ